MLARQTALVGSSLQLIYASNSTSSSSAQMQNWVVLYTHQCIWVNSESHDYVYVPYELYLNSFQALPLVSTFWGILIFGEYHKSSRRTYVLLIGMLSMFVVAVGLLMASSGHRKISEITLRWSKGKNATLHYMFAVTVYSKLYSKRTYVKLQMHGDQNQKLCDRFQYMGRGRRGIYSNWWYWFACNWYIMYLDLF